MASFPRLLPDPHRISTARGHVAAPSGAEAALAGSAKWAVGGIIGGGAAAGLLAAGSSALALYFARRVITPARVREEDQEVLAAIRNGRELQVILAATPETTVDGTYGFVFDGGKGHARIGRIVSYSPAERTVLREVEAVYSGDLSTARRGWWSGAAHPDPASIGLASEEVQIDVDGGTAPAWLVRAPEADVWAIMV
ncbi:MAG TPA: lipase, partial [Arthrobacter sp.]|nr:lipase [Arthrobacter sp.]